MINFFLLPFRALVWLVLGVIFSFPWIIILVLTTVDNWLPYALSYGFEHKTDALCKIEKANANWLTGELVLKDVSIFNSSEFYTTDCVRFKTIQCKLDLKSLLSACWHIKELSFDCYQMCFIKQEGRNNFMPLGKLLYSNPKKNFIIDRLLFNFNGFIAIKTYNTTFVRSLEFFNKKNFSFSNIYRDIPSGQKISESVQTLESVYNTLGTLFKNERKL